MNSVIALSVTSLTWCSIPSLSISAWLNQRYGTVSNQAYEFSKAIYGACLAKSERLDKVQQLFDDSSNAELPAHEREWLEAIISTARDENWESAAEQARRMMQDQAQPVVS